MRCLMHSHIRRLVLWLALVFGAAALPTARAAWGAFAQIVNDCTYDIEGTTSMGDKFRLKPGEESRTFVICEEWCTDFLGSCKDHPWSYQASGVNTSIQFDEERTVAVCFVDVESVTDTVTLTCDCSDPPPNTDKTCPVTERAPQPAPAPAPLLPLPAPAPSPSLIQLLPPGPAPSPSLSQPPLPPPPPPTDVIVLAPLENQDGKDAGDVPASGGGNGANIGAIMSGMMAVWLWALQ